VLRDRVIVPILAGLRVDREMATRPDVQNPIDAHYETLRNDMEALIQDLGITTETGMAA
jgi:hypothetical protein